ncbi:MAG TPA: hypothetical protein VE954_21510 [Oligoflexus sp.]|uniref:hypothetical protein n=1 Tax=Oligoflexus sp. TaxID=1971216 RepID=UPI002D4053F4|nr:hypothetical protein [Oligoflexus sp.]HYX35682.1 hypothetical protein [Oligoflexus sp.]
MEWTRTDEAPYPLRWIATNAPLNYQLYEVSACTVGILTSENLSSHDYLVMEAEGRRIPLRVAEILPPVRPDQGPMIKRYRLSCLDCLMELDRLLAPDASSERRLQFPRCPVNPRIYVEARWPGREHLEMLESVDISRSGLLLRSVQGSNYVSMPNDTAFPLRLDVARLWLPESVQPLARIVRTYQAYEEFKTFSYIAVQLIDWSSREADTWNRLLRRIERGFLPGLAHSVESKL